MTTISSYIDSHYEVIYSHPDSNPNDWDTFLLSEVHNNPVVLKINATFVKHFSDENSTLFLEAIPSLQTDDRPKALTDAQHSFNLNASRKHVKTLGWDIDNYHQLDAKRLAVQLVIKLLDDYVSQIFQQGNKKSPFLKDLNWRKTFQILVKKRKECWRSHKISKEKHFILTYLNQLEHFLCKAADDLAPFLRQKIFPLETEKEGVISNLQKRENQMYQLSEKIAEDDFDMDQYDQLENKVSGLRQKRHELNKNLNSLISQKCQDLNQSIAQYFKHWFPKRTISMVKTLQNARFISQGKGLFFLIAGVKHFVEGYQLPENDPESLSKFYEYVSPRKNIVILKPKV